MQIIIHILINFHSKLYATSIFIDQAIPLMLDLHSHNRCIVQY